MTNAEINEKLAMMCGWAVLQRMSEGAIQVRIPEDGDMIMNPCNSLDDCKRVEVKLGVRITVMHLPDFPPPHWMVELWTAGTNHHDAVITAEADSEPLARAKALAEVER